MLFMTVFFLVESAVVHATHIVGGEMYYNKLTGNNYQIILKVYRDCGPTNVNGTGFDPNASIGIYRTANGSLYDGNFSLPLANAVIDFVPIELENPCFVLPPDVCVQRAQYSGTINLPPTPGGYTLVYQRCCRNPSIVNLVDPGGSGATFTTRIPGSETAVSVNNSARFTNFPPVALCANAEFFFDHSATDPDGDQLVYEFCTPMLGGTPDFPAPVPPMGPPFFPVTFEAAYSSSYPIDSSPAFSIDPNTGFMTGTATTPGQYVLGVCVSEYRDGVLVNSSNRDFQFNVTVCDPNIIASIPQIPQACAGAPVQFQNNSTNATFYHWDFGVPDITSDTSTLANPTFAFPATGSYTVTLIANPGWPCADTVSTVYNSFPVIDPQILVGAYECIDGDDYYDFAATANIGAAAGIQWNFGAGSVPQFSNVINPQNIKMNPETASMEVTLTITDNSCVENDQVSVVNPPDPVASVASQELFCQGLFYAFENQSENAEAYEWNFGFPGGQFSALENPSVVFPDTGIYQIRLIASRPFTCSDTAYAEVALYDLLDPFFETPDPQCFEGNSFDFFGQGASTDEAHYEWNFGPSSGLPVSTNQNPQNISFNEPDHYPVTLTISENGCVKSYTDDVWVADNFNIEFNYSNTDGCPPVAVSIEGIAEAESPVFYQWEFSNGFSSNGSSLAYTFENPGTYDLTVTASTTSGCVESKTWQMEGIVTVHPVPQAGFNISPQTIDILNPVVNVSDLSFGGVQTNYITSDGHSFSTPDFTHSWENAGRQTITQYVINEFGCVAKTTGVVIIEGYVLHAPNSFTPNGDGINDFWMPVTLGITSYELKIFNRWGDVIFETNDATEPWLGQAEDGKHFVPDGIYPYIIRIRDSEGLSHEFEGHIAVLR